MWEDIYKYLIVFSSSMLKFFVGMAFGTGFKLPFLVTTGLVVFGMMASVILFTSILGKYFHQWVLNTFFKNRKLFTKHNRKKIAIWKKYGLFGVAFLTPPLFTPIGGSMIANGFGESKERIFLFMFASAIFWALSSSFLFSLIQNFFF